jgi:hypothetical protein
VYLKQTQISLGYKHHYTIPPEPRVAVALRWTDAAPTTLRWDDSARQTLAWDDSSRTPLRWQN